MIAHHINESDVEKHARRSSKHPLAHMFIVPQEDASTHPKETQDRREHVVEHSLFRTHSGFQKNCKITCGQTQQYLHFICELAWYPRFETDVNKIQNQVPYNFLII